MFILPKPGHITKPENIPTWMRENLHWITYKLVKARKDNRIRKIPVYWRDLFGVEVDPFDSRYWTNFEDAVAAMRSDPEGRFGIGVVLTQVSGVLCFDGDGPESNEFLDGLHEHCPSYAERSIGGVGRHDFWIGKLPHGRSALFLKSSKIEAYGFNRFIATTGIPLPVGNGHIADGRELFEQVFRDVQPPVSRQTNVVEGRCADEIATMLSWIKLDLNDYNGWCGVGMGLSNATGGADWAFNLWDNWSRETGGQKYTGTAHLYRKWNGFATNGSGGYSLGTIVELSRQAQIAYGREHREELDAIVRAGLGIREMQVGVPKPSKDVLAEVVQQLRCGIEAAPPCEGLKTLIDLNFAGMKVPFRPFAEIATLTVFGTLLGRRYKTVDGLSSALYQLLVAPTGSGKGEAFTFWMKQISRIVVGHDPHRHPNFYNASAASAQGLHGAIQRSGTTIWLRPDAAGDIAILADPQGPVNTMLRDYVYELFDASTYGAPPMFPVASIASDMRKDTPIHNCTVGVLWSTTPAAFRATYNQTVLATGWGSRALVSVYDHHAGDSVSDEAVLRVLPGEVAMWVAELTGEVYTLDMQYRNTGINGNSEIRLVKYAAEAAALIRRVEQAVDHVRRGVDNRKLPQHYAVFARTAMQTKKIALLGALIRDRQEPVISREDVSYALDYVVRCLSSLAAMFDTGDVGDADDRARQQAFVKWCQAFEESNHPRITDQMKKDMTIPLWWLNSRAKMSNAYKKYHRGSTEALFRTLELLSAIGAVSVSDKQCKVIDLEVVM